MPRRGLRARAAAAHQLATATDPVGGALANILGVGETDGIDWIKHGLQVVAGAVAVGGYLAIKKD